MIDNGIIRLADRRIDTLRPRLSLGLVVSESTCYTLAMRMRDQDIVMRATAIA